MRDAQNVYPLPPPFHSKPRRFAAPEHPSMFGRVVSVGTKTKTKPNEYVSRKQQRVQLRRSEANESPSAPSFLKEESDEIQHQRMNR